MTVAELIELLKQFPPGMRVVVRGYERGFDDLFPPSEVKLSLNHYPDWWDGPHDDVGRASEFDEIAVRLIGIRRHEQDSR